MRESKQTIGVQRMRAIRTAVSLLSPLLASLVIAAQAAPPTAAAAAPPAPAKIVPFLRCAYLPDGDTVDLFYDFAGEHPGERSRRVRVRVDLQKLRVIDSEDVSQRVPLACDGGRLLWGEETEYSARVTEESASAPWEEQLEPARLLCKYCLTTADDSLGIAKPRIVGGSLRMGAVRVAGPNTDSVVLLMNESSTGTVFLRGLVILKERSKDLITEDVLRRADWLEREGLKEEAERLCTEGPEVREHHLLEASPATGRIARDLSSRDFFPVSSFNGRVYGRDIATNDLEIRWLRDYSTIEYRLSLGLLRTDFISLVLPRPDGRLLVVTREHCYDVRLSQRRIVRSLDLFAGASTMPAPAPSGAK